MITQGIKFAVCVFCLYIRDAHAPKLLNRRDWQLVVCGKPKIGSDLVKKTIFYWVHWTFFCGFAVIEYCIARNCQCMIYVLCGYILKSC